jgi:hypothetical protein
VDSDNPFGLLLTRYIVVLPDHGWVESASWIAQIIIAALAIIAAFVAYRQLKEMADYREQRLHIANGTLLMELDKRFDSKDLIDARRIFVDMRERIKKEVAANNLKANEEYRAEKIAEVWTVELERLRADTDDDEDKYSELMSLAGFFETVGVMVKRKYISEQDAIGLFKGPLITFGRNFRKHIELRQKETGMPPGLLEHALYLYELAESAEKKATLPSA